jgi:hypothetical protein
LIAGLLTLLLAAGTWTACGDDDGGGGEQACDDGIDNDGDGLTDCDDDDCADDPICDVTSELDCGDAIDNDGDGLTDCDDDDCADDPLCDGVEVNCDDGVDNDGDGLTDCDDEECFDDPACETGETACDDGVDNDGDGLTDCDDDDCADDAACQIVVCGDTDLGTPTSEQALAGTSYSGDASDWIYQAGLDWGDGSHFLSVEMWGDFVTGGITTGSHTLGTGDEANYETCAYCVLLVECGNADCTESPDDRIFFPTAGDLQVDTLGAVGENLVGSLSNVEWVEVTIDPDTFVSTPVENGDCWNLTAEYTFDATVEAF